MRVFSTLMIVSVAASLLAGCASSSVRSSWSCALEKGGVCESTADIDNGVLKKTPGVKGGAKPDAVIGGAVAAKLWGQGGWTAGEVAGAPIREPDPIVKVAIAPWVDAAGDYHAGVDVFAVMRHGGWYLNPKRPKRLELSAANLNPTSRSGIEDSPTRPQSLEVAPTVQPSPAPRAAETTDNAGQVLGLVPPKAPMVLLAPPKFEQLPAAQKIPVDFEVSGHEPQESAPVAATLRATHPVAPPLEAVRGPSVLKRVALLARRVGQVLGFGAQPEHDRGAIVVADLWTGVPPPQDPAIFLKPPEPVHPIADVFDDGEFARAREARFLRVSDSSQ